MVPFFSVDDNAKGHKSKKMNYSGAIPPSRACMLAQESLKRMVFDGLDRFNAQARPGRKRREVSLDPVARGRVSGFSTT